MLIAKWLCLKNIIFCGRALEEEYWKYAITNCADWLILDNTLYLAVYSPKNMNNSNPKYDFSKIMELTAETVGSCYKFMPGGL